jgi:hypothetical protein
MYLDITRDRAVEPRRAPDVDVLDAAVGMEMRGLVDETTQERFGRDVFQIARERVEGGLSVDSDLPRWSTAKYHGLQGWGERWLPGLDRFARGFLFGAGTLFVFLLLWFSDLSQRITPAGGVIVAVSVYLASAGWSRLMSVSAGSVVHYSLVEADRQLTRYVTRAVATLAGLIGLLAVGYASTEALTAALGPSSVVLASMANLTLFWLCLAYTVAQQRPWLILLFAMGGLIGYAAGGAVVDPLSGLHMQMALLAFNTLGVAYMVSRAVPAYRRRHTFVEPPGAAALPRRRRRFVAALGIGYGFLILSDFVVLATVGYFNTTWNGTETYLVLKLVAIIPLLISLGVMEVLEHRLGAVVRRHEERLPSSDPGFTTAIRRAFLRSVLAFGALHVLLGLATATLLLPGMPLRGWVSESALTADIALPGLLATLGIAFALGGMFCATLLSGMGDDEVSLKWLATGLALSLAAGGSLYFALGILGAAIGFAAGTGAFLALSGWTVMKRMAAYPLLSYCQAIR